MVNGELGCGAGIHNLRSCPAKIRTPPALIYVLPPISRRPGSARVELTTGDTEAPSTLTSSEDHRKEKDNVFVTHAGLRPRPAAASSPAPVRSGRCPTASWRASTTTRPRPRCCASWACSVNSYLPAPAARPRYPPIEQRGRRRPVRKPNQAPKEIIN